MTTSTRTVTCPVCAAPTGASWRFCAHCGTSLGDAGSVHAREHHATVVVSDLQGSTALAERLDPESLRLVLDQYFDQLGRVLESYGGRIEKRIGDAMVTVFGAPVQRDDDATRAALAVAECQATLAALNQRLDTVWGVRLTNRTGISTGPVLITDAGGGHRVLSGPALDLAMALEPVAPPFEALVSTPTVPELQSFVQLDAGTLHTLKNGRQVVAHRLAAVASDEASAADGAGAGTTCPSCGTPKDLTAEPAATWCPECGTKFSAGGHVQSRRTLTIVFADLRTTGTDDADVARRAVVRCFDEARSVLEHHGGIVEKFIGDAVMAVFGLDRRREDDALRAVRAGMDLQQRIGVINSALGSTIGAQVEVRIGINTGPVIAGDPALGQRLVTGDAVNIAARLEQAASPGQVLVGALTRRLCGSGLVVQEVAPLPLKGKAQLVPASVVIEVPAGGVATGQPKVPMVGRDEPFQQLCALLPLTIEGRRLHRVDITGEAGTGKSRLVNEFLDIAVQEAHVERTLCLPYGEGITFWPVVDLVRQLCDFEAADTTDQALAKLDAVTGNPKVTARLASLVGLSAAPFALSEIFWAVRQLIQHLAAHRPFVLIIDSLHWAEPTLLDLLDHLLANVQGPVLLVTMARPDDDDSAGAPASPVNSTTRSRIALEPLADADLGTLLRLSLDGELPAALHQQVVRSSAGNPLFVEQLAIMLVDDGRLERRGDQWVLTAGVEELDVPPTIEALLAARIDALTDGERATLEPASIMGREFPRAAVAALLSGTPTGGPSNASEQITSALTELGRRKLVVPAREPDELVDHRFANLLIRDVVYAGLLKRTRAAWHDSFATWLEDVLGSRIAEFAEVVGYHLEQSFLYQRQLGVQRDATRDIAQRAFSYLAPAGDRAYVRGDMPAASSLLSRAAALLPDTDPVRNRMLIRAGEARIHTGNFAAALAHFDASEEGSLAADDRVVASAARLARATLRFQTGDGLDDIAAREVVRELHPVFLAADDHASSARCWRLLAYAELTNSQWGAAERAMTALISEARKASDTVLELRVLPGLVGFALHGPAPVTTAIEQARELLTSTARDRRARALTQRYLGHLMALDDQGESGRELCLEARESLVELGWNFDAALVAIDLGPIELILGKYEEAERVLRSGYDLLRDMGEQNYSSTMAALLANALRCQGRLEEALELTDVAAASTSAADVLTQAVWREVRASTLVGLGRGGEAESFARDALGLVLDTDGPASQGEAYAVLAEVLEALGRTTEALDAVLEAQRCFTAKGHRPGMDRAESLVNRLS